MPYTPAQTKERFAYEKTSAWKSLIIAIDDALLIGKVDFLKKGIKVPCVWKKLPDAFLPALKELYDAFGWTMAERVSSGMSDEYYLLLSEKVYTRCEAVAGMATELRRCELVDGHITTGEPHSFTLTIAEEASK